jgi:hypothetical protein
MIILAVFIGIFAEVSAHWTDHISQSSIFNDAIRLNSRVLCVTNVRPCCNAIAAIWRSCGPMGLPINSNSRLILPQVLALMSSNGNDAYG